MSLTLDGFEPQELATILDASFGIETRAGLHCAPGMHRCLGTFDERRNAPPERRAVYDASRHRRGRRRVPRTSTMS